ncbi:TPA: hypothetical protein PMK43_001946 [Vibrio cholerae]|nr:hypothetical protein [Vibrio cholerae]
MPKYTLTYDEFMARIKDQGHEDILDATFQCPSCKTLQSLRQFIEVSGLERSEANRYFGFSCIGRFNDKGIGCNWTLGGLFKIHELEVLTKDGEKHMHFMPMTPEQVKAESNNAAE